MTFSEHIVFFLLVFARNNFYVSGSVIPVTKENSTLIPGGYNEKNLEQEIFQELNHLSARKQREIFSDLEKQREQLNVSQRSLMLSESEKLSPLNVEELKNIKKSISTSNSTLPAIRNKRTLNFLLSMVARAMGYTLTPSNPDAEWIPRQRPQPPCSTTPPPCPTTPPPCSTTPAPAPCSTTPPPCPTTPPPCPTMPPPCTMPPSPPPCGGSMTAMQSTMQFVTVPPSQIDPNTIRYPVRSARTIPLLNFAPLPQGVRVPYPPLLQALTQGSSPCAPPQPSQPPCATPAPSPSPCGTTPAPPPPPCSTPAPSPAPCASKPRSCQPTPPSPPSCSTPAPSPPPCATPAPKTPPCTTAAPPPPPCAPPAPKPAPCATPAPSPPPCATTPAPRPSCAPLAPAPCGTPPPCGAPPPPSPPQKPPNPKKASILLEYDDPVRIQIFSNEKKYLPASGNIFSGHDEGNEELTHSYFFPSHEENKKSEDIEEEEEQEEHVEAEEDDGEYGQKNGRNQELRYHEEEDERLQANNAEEEDESETNLSIVKKPIQQEQQKKKRRLVSPKKETSKEEKENGWVEEKTVKMKKPKRKKWVRIVKKQRRKTKTDSNPQETYKMYSSDSATEGSFISQRVFGRSVPRDDFYTFDDNHSNFGDSSGQSTRNRTQVKKVVIDNDDITPEVIESYINPFVQEPEDERRKKLEKAVEKYVEEYVEKQLGTELIKNTGVPKTTVFEFTPKNGPKIQTITTTVAKTSSSRNPASLRPQFRPESQRHYTAPYFGGESRNARVIKKNSYGNNFSFEDFSTRP